MVQISEVKGNKRDNRTAAHTHIRGLGLKADGRADKQMSGFVGQVVAREVGYTPVSPTSPGDKDGGLSRRATSETMANCEAG